MSNQDWQMRCFGCMELLRQADETCPCCGWDNRIRANAEPMLAQTVLNQQYILGRMLGKGGFGVTYIGYDLNLRQRVAIKEYFPSAIAYRHADACTVRPFVNSRDSFAHGKAAALEEGRTLARMGNIPNIVRVYNAFEANDTAYIVMDYIEGETLAKLLERQGPLDWQRALNLLYPIMDALESVHERNCFHRDVSPDNIMLRHDSGREDDTVLLDFGNARNEVTETVTLRPGYAPPEQYNRKHQPDARMDEYALCATLYHLITGRAPDDASMRAVCQTDMPSPRAMGVRIPESVEAVLLTGMDVRRENRYPTIAALRAAFKAASGMGPASVETVYVNVDPPAGGDPPGGKTKRQRFRKNQPPGKRRQSRLWRWVRAVLITLAVLVVLLILLVVWFSVSSSMRYRSIVARTTAPAPTATLTAAPTATAAVTATPTASPTATPTPTPAPTATQTAVAQSAPQPISRESVRKSDGERMMSETLTDTLLTRKSGSVLGNADAQRSAVTSIRFADRFDGAPTSVWDVSEAGDGGVLAWLEDGVLTIAANGGVIAPKDSARLFANYRNLVSIDFGGCFRTDGATDMRDMFRNDEKLTGLDLSCFDTARVTDMSGMFYNCNALAAVNVSGFNTAKVTNMANMFDGCKALGALDVSGFNTARVTDFSCMFQNCSRLKALDVSRFSTGSARSMKAMFRWCSRVVRLRVSRFDTSKVTSMEAMFADCRTVNALDVKGFDTRTVESMNMMFLNCQNITKLELTGFSTAAVTGMRSMFAGCKSLGKLDLRSFNTARAGYLDSMFRGCSQLSSIQATDAFVRIGTMRAGNNHMFDGCPAAVTIDGKQLRAAEWLERNTVTLDLKRNGEGSGALWLQSRLKALGYLSGTADGVFGSNTESALKRFQRSRGLRATGIADKQTLMALCAA